MITIDITCQLCGEPATREAASERSAKQVKYCWDCSEKRRIGGTSRMRQRRKEAGVCLLCGGELTGDKLNCDMCLSKHNVNQNAYNTSRRQVREAEGLCVTCGKFPASAGIRICEECRKASAAQGAAIHASRLRDGLCVSCGGERDSKFKSCSACRSKSRGYVADSKEELIRLGLCIQCGEVEAQEGKKSCAICLEATRLYSAQVREKRRENGKCLTCGHRDALENYVQCGVCRERDGRNRAAKSGR